MGRIDKEVFYWSLWKLLHYLYSIALVLAIFVGIKTILYFINGMKEDDINTEGLIIVWVIIVFTILLKHILKPFFKKKTNNHLD